MKILEILFFLLPVILGFIPARIIYWRLKKSSSKYKWLISSLVFVFFTFLTGAIIGVIILSQMNFSRGGAPI